MTPITSNELEKPLPCPFCGKEAEIAWIYAGIIPASFRCEGHTLCPKPAEEPSPQVLGAVIMKAAEERAASEPLASSTIKCPHCENGKTPDGNICPSCHGVGEAPCEPLAAGKPLGQILFESENPFPLARKWSECHIKVKENYERDAQAIALALADKDKEIAMRDRIFASLAKCAGVRESELAAWIINKVIPSQQEDDWKEPYLRNQIAEKDEKIAILQYQIDNNDISF